MTNPSSASPAGSSVTPIYSNRQMEFVSISKGEIDNISSETTQATVFFTLASFVASAAVGIYTNAAFYDKVTPTGEVAIGVAAPVLLAIALAFAAIGAMHVRSRRKIWTRITKEAAKP